MDAVHVDPAVLQRTAPDVVFYTDTDYRGALARGESVHLAASGGVVLECRLIEVYPTQSETNRFRVRARILNASRMYYNTGPLGDD